MTYQSNYTGAEVDAAIAAAITALQPSDMVGPFSRNGNEAAGVQLQEISNNVDLLASTGAVDGNTAPTQFAVKSFVEARYTRTDELAEVATTGAYANLLGLPTLGTAAATDATDYATAEQGGLAASAVQPGDLANVATSGFYGDLTGLPVFGTVVETDAADYATAYQGMLADTAIQPSDLSVVAATGAYDDLSGLPTLGTASLLDAGIFANQVVQLDGTGKLPAIDGSQLTNIGSATGAGDVVGPDSASGKVMKSLGASLSTVATTGEYSDLSGLPALGTAAATAATDYATAVQGSLADTATQPYDLATVATTGAYGDLSGLPTLGTAAATAATDYATAAQGALADSATQPGDLATVAATGAYGDLSGRPALGTLSIQNADGVSFTGSVQEQVVAITGTTPILDPSNGTIQTHTLTGATTYTDAFSAGEAITLMVDDGTARTITWPTITWVNNGGAAPTLATTGYTVIALWKVSTTLYGALVGDGS